MTWMGWAPEARPAPRAEWLILGIVWVLVVVALVVAAYFTAALGQTRDEMRAMEGRTGVTRENACLLLRLQLRPCEADYVQKPKQQEKQRGER